MLKKWILSICRSSARRPLIWFFSLLVLTGPAVYYLNQIRIDLDLIRLLPQNSQASMLTRDLKEVISDSGHFSVMIEGEDRERLLQSVRYAAERIERLEGIQQVQYRYPIDFIKAYRFSLITSDYLDRILEEVLRWQSEVSPFVENLAEEGEASFRDREEEKDMKANLRKYRRLTSYHESEDGRVMGLFVRTERGVTSLGDLRVMFSELEKICEETAARFGVWTGVGGSHRNKLDEYQLLMSDLKRSGAIASLLILCLLLISFRSFPVIIVVLYPLFVGLVWAFALVPLTVGDLNLITAFLLLILFGMGVDYAIHLVKRFRLECSRKSLDRALADTYLTTGYSVIVSGLTTAFALSILAVSDFRGFSEFGLVGALSIVMMLLAMFLVLPSAMILGFRLGLVKPKKLMHHRSIMSRGYVTAMLLVLTGAGIVAASMNLTFDYNFRNLEFDKDTLTGSREVKDKQRQVYSGSISPGAIYVAEDLTSLDAMLNTLNVEKTRPQSPLGRVRSLRDFFPGQREWADRLQIISDIQEELHGSWVRRVEDPDKQELIREFKDWAVPQQKPGLSEIPPTFRDRYLTKDGTGRFLVTIHPAADRKDGKNAMAFTDALYALDLPEGVQGPVGETAVFAEILWIVTGEGVWLVLGTFMGVFLLVWLFGRSLKDTLWIMLPLVSAVILTLGLIAAAGFRLNFFNIVVIPALLGMGVDNGVHYYRRWSEKRGRVAKTQRELFEPLTVCTLTTMLGYSGMIFAHHPGIHSIGILACIGLSFIWGSSLFLLPGLLDWARRKRD
jgi:predicted RND superfamily exporter protein